MRSQEALESFTIYCRTHPDQRFWQALANWSRWKFIYGSDLVSFREGDFDTFHLEGLDGTR